MMKKRFEKKVVLVIGATGGLGRAFSNAFLKEGAILILAGRNMEMLQSLFTGLNFPVRFETIDIIKPESIQHLCERVKSEFGFIDIVINAAGYDIRKSLADHDVPEIEKLLDTDLLGPILITKTILPFMNADHNSSIVHIGGFTDGRMAFPYYSVDAASRAGLFTFIEAMNRELRLEGSKKRLVYFCPSPADTDAERPYHSLWKKMGISIVSVEKVAEALLKGIEEKKAVSIMGGVPTVVFAKLNSIYPRLADVIVMNNYGKILRDYLYGANEKERQHPKEQQKGFLYKIAIILVILSFVLYGLIAAVPFLPFALAQKAIIVSALVASGEISWWLGVVILGKQVVEKYRTYLNPCVWFSCIKKFPQT